MAAKSSHLVAYGAARGCCLLTSLSCKWTISWLAVGFFLLCEVISGRFKVAFGSPGAGRVKRFELKGWHLLMERRFLRDLWINLFSCVSLKKKTRYNLTSPKRLGFFLGPAGTWYFTDCESRPKTVQIIPIGAKCLIPGPSLSYQRRTGRVGPALSSKASRSQPSCMFFSSAF